jgi:hypothetical protein
MENNNKSKEDIVELKIGAYGLKVNLVALWRWFFVKQKTNHVVVVAQRFKQLFNDHSIATTQIPRFISQVTLETLKNTPESLIPALSDDVIDQVVNLFQIKRSWLEGLGNQIYDRLWCYKCPRHFFEDIARLDFDDPFSRPVLAFCQSDTINYKRNRRQTIVLVLAEKIANLENNAIYRYKIYGDGWDWSYWKCRIQLKAMVRVLYKIKETIVPLYKVNPDTLQEIVAGRLVPSPVRTKAQFLHNISLEDFALYLEESAVSKESEELDQVEQYIENFNLENFARQLLTKTIKKVKSKI